jgi:thioesterase domain-containing protein
MLHLKFEEEGIAAHCVLGQANIIYLLPVKGDIKARCKLPDDGSVEKLIQHLKKGERSRIELKADICTEDGVAVVYTGNYSAFVKQN